MGYLRQGAARLGCCKGVSSVLRCGEMEIPVIRTLVYWGLYWCPLILTNYLTNKPELGTAFSKPRATELQSVNPELPCAALQL